MLIFITVKFRKIDYQQMDYMKNSNWSKMFNISSVTIDDEKGEKYFR